MKKLVLISGTMGVGKSAVTSQLAKQTDNSAYLDGDWCWMIQPFVVNEENKEMVLRNIHFLLNSFLHNSTLTTIFFCWVMDQEAIVQAVLAGLDLEGVEVQHFSLVASAEKLRENIEKDLASGKRKASALQNSIARLGNYAVLDSIKVDLSQQTIADAVKTLKALMS